MGSAKATPRPWKWSEDKRYPTTDLVGADGTSILQIYESHGGGWMPENEADSELIVRAVNAHDALVEALEEALFMDDISDHYGLSSRVREKAKAALLLAKGEAA